MADPFISLTHKQAIEKADTLIEALGWIRKFRDTTTVIKLGGSILEHPGALRHLLLDIVFMTTLGMRVIVVHGGGPKIKRELEATLERKEKQAMERISQAENEAREEFRTITADLAIAATRQVLSEQIEQSKADELIDEAITELPDRLS